MDYSIRLFNETIVRLCGEDDRNDIIFDDNAHSQVKDFSPARSCSVLLRKHYGEALITDSVGKSIVHLGAYAWSPVLPSLRGRGLTMQKDGRR